MSELKGITVNTTPEEEAHIYAEDDAAIFQSLFGTDGVSTIGSQCDASIQNNNKVRIADGVLCVGGHFARVPYGDYVDVDIANGNSGKKRNDIICAQFSTTGAGGIDTMQFIVIKGEEGNTPKDPAIVQENIYGGGKTRNYPLYRVKLEGLSINAVEKLFLVIPTAKELLSKVNVLTQKMNARCITKCGTIVVKIPTNSNSVKVFSDTDINNLLGITGASNANTTVSFANGDGQMTLHLDGATYLNGSWYATFNGLTTEETMCRVNYIIAYGGTSSAGTTIATQSKTIFPTVNEQVIRPDDGYDALSEVIVREIPYKETTESGSTTVQIG